MSLATEFLDSAIKRLRECKALGDKTFVRLSDEEMHRRPNESSNSLAVIIQHLYGNMLSRWTNFLTEDGEKPWRKRDEEFETHGFSKRELIGLWEHGWSVCLNALQSLAEADLLKTVTIRSQPLTVVDAVNRQLAHYSYHIGQVVYLGRWMKEGEWESLSIPKRESKVDENEPLEN